jgi:antitoxin (DNA-binding transcriptional repressor) of toxin-antitoxin stability system
MHEKTVDLQETPTNLQDLLSLVRAGTEIILTEGATPLARVVPITSSSMPRVAGLHAGAIWVSDDFDEELPEPFWTGTA